MSLPSLDWIIALAQQAGELIRRERHHLNCNYKHQTELVTQADVAADGMIHAALSNSFPSHAILSEELAPSATTEHEFLWVIDPIDGTVNYAHGHPQVAVSIALYHHGNAVLGVVHNPFLQETFAAQAGRGAWLNRERIQCAATDDLRRAIIATGFPYHKDDVPTLVARLQQILSHCADIRRLGSAALDICWVACGRLDGYYESVKPWDFAAARLIAIEAGAKAGHYIEPPAGNPELCGEHLLVSAPAIYSQLRSLLR